MCPNKDNTQVQWTSLTAGLVEQERLRQGQASLASKSEFSKGGPASTSKGGPHCLHTSGSEHQTALRHPASCPDSRTGSSKAAPTCPMSRP
jgi:hypothetical protein